MKKIIGLSILMFTLAFNPAHADEDLSLFNKAMDRMLASSYDGWTFLQTTTGEEDEKVEHFDSSKEKENRWTLLTLNGKKPTKKQIKKYLNDKRNDVLRQEKEDENGDGEDAKGNKFLIKLIKPGSVKFIEANSSHKIYQFQPKMDGGDEAMEGHVFGEITVLRDNPMVTQIRLYIKEAFSVKIAKIKEFETLMKFAPVNPENQATSPIFIQSIQAKAKGKAALFFSFDRSSLVTYSDFVEVSP